MLRTVTGTGDGAAVADIELDEANRATFTIDEPVVVVLTAVAPKTTEPASFRITGEAHQEDP